jgi:8-oxo-dGTP diphosphatase
MTRAQCIVYRQNKVLMAKHRLGGKEWWCLPGGAVEAGETPAEAAIRELREECGVHGRVVRETARHVDSAQDHSHTYLVDTGEQVIRTGSDPEFPEDGQILVDVRWMALSEIPERDRAFLWAAGLLGIKEFLDEASSWGNAISYP